MSRKYKLKNTGFSLLELLLALGILGIITIFALSISHSSKNLTKTASTKSRMKEIKRAAVDYYSGHRDLPAFTGANEVPVATSALNLEQKHRLDAWGRYFHYDRVAHAADPMRTDITGITVDGKKVAAVLISGGPDQAFEATGSPYLTAGDDIVLSVGLAEQAFAIAMNDLQVLQSKVQAFDAIFAGIDNNSSGNVDDANLCVAAADCPFNPSNDPNCGSATLDTITSYLFTCGSLFPVTSAAAFISSFYDLSSTITLDPWLNIYAWGDPSTVNIADPRYHKFFSYGPDGPTGSEDDDIVP